MKKIVAIGPESTGKSTLCSELAQHYHTRWVKEYAREYLLKHGTAYNFDDLLTIAKGQLKLEEEGSREAGNNLLFIDTDMWVMKVWCEFVFNRCHTWILDRIAERKYDLYLLCNTDLAWTHDELREYPDPDTRRQLFCHYKDILINQQVPWVEISGNNEQRLQIAVKAVDLL